MRYQIKGTRLQPEGDEMHLADAEDLVVAAALLAAISTEAHGRFYNFMLIDTQDSHADAIGLDEGAIIALVG